MKNISGFLSAFLILCTVNAYAAAPVATTAGSNLTAFNGNSGATNNAMWNAYMNPRSNMVTTAPTADFTNCNAVIMRCAQPKCANGGCTSLEIARPIVSGCIESNSSCKQYEEDLIEYISAQLVATSNANATQAKANADAQAAASANAVAQQSAQQIEQMQQQMMQMQQQMQQQSADTAAQIQAALEQQQQATNQAIADAAAASSAATVASMPTQTTNTNTVTTTATNSAVTATGDNTGLTTAQQLAAASGVSADLLVREQISGQILTSIENAEVSLKEIKAVLNDVYDYAGCDSSGDNCTGPRRVKTFKEKAMNFFDPYNNVLSELYDALILAQSIGVDITDIYMMLNGTCNAWALYLCAPGQVMHYTSNNCINNISVPIKNAGETGTVLGNASCKVGQVVPMSDGGCQLTKMLTNNDEIEKNWLYPEIGSGTSDNAAQVRVGCASEALENSTLFRNMKKQASIDIDTLQRIIEQDAPSVYGNSIFNSSSTTKPNPDGIKFCGVGAEGYADLQKLVSLKQLPDSVCVSDQDLNNYVSSEKIGGLIVSTNNEAVQNARFQCRVQQLNSNGQDFNMKKCLCENASSMIFGLSDEIWPDWNGEECVCDTEGYKFDSGQLKCVKEPKQQQDS